MATFDFVPIEILKPTAEDQKNAKAHPDNPKVFEVFFRLSGYASQEWSRIFNEVWSGRMRTAPLHLRVLAYVKGRQLGITGNVEYLSEVYRNLQADVLITNQKFQEWLDLKAKADAQAEQKQEEMKKAQAQALADAFKKILGS